ncbi:hypothetical protein CFOL_v3_20670 [Cephalotus follicularis]|uniref:Exo_endo_phos domain-containing protein n=1 Tax=Cephalotus follicularis TaxID=3775 RepID=A0A1Q3CAR9_CEPFO|nr:hypothetical protein CFOL_v3_20670 [Cephalotus follicularis]
MGDFNVSRHPQEQLRGSPKFSKAMMEFNDCLNSIEVDDIRSVGSFYTWSNKRDGVSAVNKKLDRALGKWGWHQTYNQSYALFHTPGVSDHSPVSVTLAAPLCKDRKPFKFLNFWTNDSRFMGLVRRVWGQRCVGNPLEVVLTKLRNLKRELKCAFRKINPSTLKDTTRKELESIQSKLQQIPADADLLLQEKHCITKLQKIKLEEESFLRQKSRINWLKLGDGNNKFFHRAVTSLHHRNHVDRLQHLDGSWACNQDEVEKLAVEHFKGFLGQRSCQPLHNNLEYHKKFTAAQKALMGRRVTDEEIKGAFWALNPNKAPGPDGFNGHFFRTVWDIVERDMLAACRFFFEQPYMPKGLNATIITLVPKNKNASNISD